MPGPTSRILPGRQQTVAEAVSRCRSSQPVAKRVALRLAEPDVVKRVSRREFRRAKQVAVGVVETIPQGVVASVADSPSGVEVHTVQRPALVEPYRASPVGASSASALVGSPHNPVDIVGSLVDSPASAWASASASAFAWASVLAAAVGVPPVREQRLCRTCVALNGPLRQIRPS